MCESTLKEQCCYNINYSHAIAYIDGDKVQFAKVKNVKYPY